MAEPDTMGLIVEHLANGGALTVWCDERDVNFGSIMNWIREDEKRKEAWDFAGKAREEWAKERYLAQLREIAHLDITKIYEDDGTLKPMKDWPPYAGQVIVSVKVDELFEGFGKERQQIGVVKEVKLSDRLKALQLLGTNLGIFVERHLVTVSKTHEQLIIESYENKKEVKDVPSNPPHLGPGQVPEAGA